MSNMEEDQDDSGDAGLFYKDEITEFNKEECEDLIGQL